jgi:hypothetical protein
MSRLRISVTNYTSLSREIIKTMITNMGAQYTSQLTPDNTHLICAAAEGEKYRKAQEWNVNIVNHLWIEDCWQKWTLQALTKPQYLVHRMSLSRVVGDIPVPDGFLNKLASVEMAAEMRTPQQPTSRKRMRAQTSDLPPKMISTSHVADCSILMDEDNHQVPIIFANHPPLGESVEGDTVALVTSVKEEEPTAETEQQTS